MASPVQSLGVQKEEGPELFGEIRDVVEDPQGRVLVLDNDYKEVRVFASEGEYLGAIGREGEAPGEFQYPAYLSLFENGDLMVAGRSGRVQIFAPKGDTYERIGGFNLEFTPEDACILDEEIYLHGALAQQPEQSIHVYTRGGDHDRSFGPVYQAENEFIRQGLSDGNLACDRSTGTVAFAFTYAPLVYGHAPDGEPRWTVRLQPFTPNPVEQGISDRGTTSLRHRSEPGTDLFTSLVDVPGPGVIAQRMRFPPEGSDRADSPLYTYWVSAEDGTGSYVGETTVGGVGEVYHVARDRLFSASSVPFPKVNAYDTGEVAWVATSLSE